MDYMQRALSLAASVMGRTSPNPAVGAVIAKNGRVIGEGATQPPGRAHAEIVALENARDLAQGATMYVTLEPCCFTGRTPPCTKALIEAGIAEVHVATLDPNPKVNGKGLKELQQAGIKTCTGAFALEARKINEAYNKYIVTGRPFVTAKFAVSLDGKIATPTGESRWITGEEARRKAHQLRGMADAVMVGVRTVIADNPRLTVRNPEDKPRDLQPLRVVVDSEGRTPLDAQIFQEPGKTLVATGRVSPNRQMVFREQGVESVMLPGDRGKVDLEKLMALLGQKEHMHVLVEGGGELLGSLFDLKLVDKVVAFVAAAIIGGKDAPTAVGGLGAGSLNEVVRLRDVEVERLGLDIMVTGYMEKTEA